jgi:hypothetical protein
MQFTKILTFRLHGGLKRYSNYPGSFGVRKAVAIFMALCQRWAGGLVMLWERRQILVLEPDLRVAQRAVGQPDRLCGLGADPTPVASSLFPPTEAIFCDYYCGIWGSRSSGWVSCRSLVFGEAKMRSAVLLQCVFHIFRFFSFFSHGHRKMKNCKIRIFVTRDSTLRWWQSAARNCAVCRLS